MAALEIALKRAPQFLEPIEDLSILDEHRDILEFLIAPFFPVQSWNVEFKALGQIFSERVFYTSPRFENIIGHKQNFVLKEVNQEKNNLTVFWRLLYAYKMILGKFYNLSLVIDQPMIYSIAHQKTGLPQYYKLNSYAPFSVMEPIGPLPDLSLSTFKYLVNNFHNMDLWMEHLPPENFRISGFGIHSFVDVTVEEATTRLEHILQNNQGNISDESFGHLQRELKILFRLADIRLGLASLQGDGTLNFQSSKKSWNSLKIRDAVEPTQVEIHRSIYGQILRENQSLFVEDLCKRKNHTRVEAELLNLGVRNIVLSPLLYQGKFVGILEITSPNPGDINVMSTYKLRQVIQFFARAVHENREQFESKVQRVVKENYTAIHPTVEWRFREAAIRNLEKSLLTLPPEPEPILFENVYPLYGSADIRGSSDQRNNAIRDDLILHMDQSRSLLQKAYEIIPLTIIGELDHTLSNKIGNIRKRMSTGDESSIIEFILNEVNPLLLHLQKTNPVLKTQFRSFMDQTQSGKKLLYKKRKAYESSLKKINDALSSHLLEDQQNLQKIFPHYFEKYQTDGVEYNIYIGSALVKDREFDMVYLRNLRLCQLISACEMARTIHNLQDRLEEPLEITQLILVHSMPVNIRFRMEEKQFDIDGAYNVRYEIMKKRIDKAVIKGTKERITQPGCIAIIYAMEKEKKEYSRYIEFLLNRGYIKENPEHVQLEELQGLQGLKAIRLKVELETSPGIRIQEELDMLEVTRKMSVE